MQSLSVLWLHATSPGDAKTLPVVEYGLSDAFREFCHDVFNVRMPLEYPPLRLTTIAAPEELPSALFGGSGRDACLFLVDDDLFESTVEGLLLKDWLRTYIPAVPKVVLTKSGHKAITKLPQRRWTKKPLRVLEHPEKYRERMVHLFKSFWMPRFWSVLKQYVQVRADTTANPSRRTGGSAVIKPPRTTAATVSFNCIVCP